MLVKKSYTCALIGAREEKDTGDQKFAVRLGDEIAHPPARGLAKVGADVAGVERAVVIQPGEVFAGGSVVRCEGTADDNFSVRLKCEVVNRTVGSGARVEGRVE